MQEGKQLQSLETDGTKTIEAEKKEGKMVVAGKQMQKVNISENGVQLSDLDSLQRFCKMAHASGFFGSRATGEALIRELAQAAVKVEYGLEIGLKPISALMNVYTVDGKPSLSSGAIGGLIRKSGKYTYTVSSTDQQCTIEWFERYNGQREPLGQSSFNMEDAKKAGLAGRNPWKRYPKAMLFARALTQGARMFCQDIFLGGVYTPEELSDGKMTEDDFEGGVERQVEVTVVDSPSDLFGGDDD
ncbi:MAG: hypothetical protein HN738_02550 [Gammaproteobacteria bacterium]|jgi:hypothetical protein|nr:hypothetical protein [Gammaproteobacteria bacterium]